MNKKMSLDSSINIAAAKTTANKAVAGKSWSFSATQLTWLCSLLFVAFYNQPFWQALWIAIVPQSFVDLLFVASIGALLTSLTALVLCLIALPYVFKPAMSAIIFGAAAAAYFMHSYGVAIDSVMIQNTMETDVGEASGLLSVKFFLYLLMLGAIPTFLLWRVRVHYRAFWREILAKLKTIGAALLISILLILAFSADYASFFRNHKSVRQMANPLNFIYGGIAYAAADTGKKELTKIGQDAHLGQLALQQTKPTLLVFVVGETARADHFGLNGYSRDTTPLLARENVINFSHFTSCGTSTAVSVPCMFSDRKRDDYEEKEARSREGLLDVIRHAGLPVLWRDNNSGCKGTCDRVQSDRPAQALSAANRQLPQLCEGDECFDKVLLRGLDDYLAGGNTSQVIVLHQQGSHGPEYYRRYPKADEHYTPVCKTNQLQDCSDQEVINAYDNSIRYTDDFLYTTIEWLKRQESAFNPVFIYLSDHGESLGENRIYLHGMPYSFAPDAQKHVPFVAWFSDGFLKENHLDESCIRGIADQEFSQDNIFHSLLGLLNIKTEVQQPSMDMFASCRH